MEFLESVVKSMKEQEVREFRYFLNRHPQSGTGENAGIRRDITLLELLRKNIHNKENQDFSKQLYGNQDRNAYHQLRNRLRKSLEEFIFFESSRKGGEYEIRKQLEIARFFFQRREFPQALNAIHKAEVLAQDDQQFAELENVYNLMISFATQIPDINLGDTIQKRKANQIKLEKQLHYLYIHADIRKILENENTFSSHIDVDYALNKVMMQHGIREEDPDHAGLWLEITALVSEVLIRKNLKSVLEQYLVLKHHEFNERGVFSSAGNGNKLRMLWQIAGLMYCNKRFDSLEKFLFELKHETSKLHDYYPGLGEKVRFIEAVAAIRTRQFSRCKQILDQLNPVAIPNTWLLWAKALLAAEEKDIALAVQYLHQIDLQANVNLNTDYFLLSIDCIRLNHNLLPDFNLVEAKNQLNTRFESWLSHNPNCGYATRWRVATHDALPDLSISKLPEAGSIGFLILQA
jgi:hypothetical protein